MAVSTRTGFARWILIRAACNDYHRPFPPRNAQSEGPNRRSSVTIYDPNRTRLWTGCRSPHAGAPQPARQNRRDRRIAGVSVRQPLVDTSPTASTSRSSRPICSSSPIRGRCDDRRAASYPERGKSATLSQQVRSDCLASQRGSKDQLRGCVDTNATVDAARTAVRVKGPTAP